MTYPKNTESVESEGKNKLFQGVGIIVSVAPAILLVVFLYMLANKFEDINMSDENQKAFIDMMGQMLVVLQDYGDKFLLLASNVLTAYGTSRAMKTANGK